MFPERDRKGFSRLACCGFRWLVEQGGQALPIFFSRPCLLLYFAAAAATAAAAAVGWVVPAELPVVRFCLLEVAFFAAAEHVCCSAKFVYIKLERYL